jgi:hypothetical protein
MMPQTKLKGQIALVLVSSILLLTIAGLSKAYAQETFSLEIDGQNYEIAYEITGGTVKNMTADTNTQTLTVAINSTDDGTLKIEIPTQALDAKDGDFSVFIDGEGGNFVVDELQSTNGSRVLQIEFPNGAEQIEIVGTTMGQGQQPTQPTQQTFSLEIDGQNYEIAYEITGGSVKNMSADPATMTLLVTINSTSDGVLTIHLPKAVMNADDKFSVMIDGGSNTTVNESETTDGARTLAIEFSQGSSEIAIMGTYMVPEFGVISAIVLASGVVAVLIASWKYSKFRGLQPI